MQRYIKPVTLYATVITTNFTLLYRGDKATVVGSQEGKYGSPQFARHLELHALATTTKNMFSVV